jgi:hypothetical protein
MRAFSNRFAIGFLAALAVAAGAGCGGSTATVGNGGETGDAASSGDAGGGTSAGASGAGTGMASTAGTTSNGVTSTGSGTAGTTGTGGNSATGGAGGTATTGGTTGPGGASSGTTGQPCVDNVLCAMGKHWDPNACACVPNGDGGSVDGGADSATCDPTLICPQIVTCVDGLEYPTGCGPTNCDKPLGSCADGGHDAGATKDACVDNVLCKIGEHWDSSACACVPNGTDAGSTSDAGRCVSGLGGHCGGFVANPCVCAAGLKCRLSPIPDVGGTCGP